MPPLRFLLLAAIMYMLFNTLAESVGAVLCELISVHIFQRRVDLVHMHVTKLIEDKSSKKRHDLLEKKPLKIDMISVNERMKGRYCHK